MTRLWAAVCLVALAGSIGCGDDGGNPREQCSATRRLVVEGRVGPTSLDVSRNDPFAGGEATQTFLTLVLEAGDDPHLIAFTTNTVLAEDSLWTALLDRLQSGAADAGRLTVATRPSDIPCDPAQGSLCAAFGVDANGDGNLLGAGEVLYPVESGELQVQEVTGNAFVGDFEITFGPATNGGEAGDDRGGTLSGCFRLFRESDRQTLF